MRGVEIRVAGELHHFELPESLGQPSTDGRPPQVVEGTPFNAGTLENPAERPVEDRDNLLA